MLLSRHSPLEPCCQPYLILFDDNGIKLISTFSFLVSCCLCVEMQLIFALIFFYPATLINFFNSNSCVQKSLGFLTNKICHL
jgi:hypothetical protein